MVRRALLPMGLVLALVAPQAVLAHSERPTESPPRPGSVPDQGRAPTAVLNVCKSFLGANLECAYQHIQAAVNAAPDGALVRIWPGVYREEPSRAAPELPPDNPDGTFSYEFQVANPNSENLVAVVGKKNLTLRGMGDGPLDVVVDVEFDKHVGIRGDRADGIIIENLSVWHAYDHGVYVLDTDGFIIDRVHSGYSREYPFLTFANDHGLMKNCEAFGGGDGGLYPGGSADTPGRFSMEIANCRSYHNVLGYSGTQGDHVWVHDTEFFDNALGFVSDSETDHPNYPQNNLVFERNRVHGNNFNVYDEGSDVRATVFADEILIPVGVGVFLATGNANTVQSNQVWDHDRFGVWLASGEGLVIGPTSEPPAVPFASSGNRFIGNRMFAPAGVAEPGNATDFGWDGMGTDNCWEANTRSADGDPATSDALLLPPCNTPGVDEPIIVPSQPMPLTPPVPNIENASQQAALVFVEGKPVCAHLGTEPCVWGPGPAPGLARNLPASEGGTTDRSYVPSPASCGPKTCK